MALKGNFSKQDKRASSYYASATGDLFGDKPTNWLQLALIAGIVYMGYKLYFKK